MCRSNVIIYQNETKFEIYCNDKTESHHITEHQLPKAQIFISPIISLIFPFLSISQHLKLFYFSTISYLDCWEKIDNLFTDGNREKIMYGQSHSLYIL
jgi:hypothetical protein